MIFVNINFLWISQFLSRLFRFSIFPKTLTLRLAANYDLIQRSFHMATMHRLPQWTSPLKKRFTTDTPKPFVQLRMRKYRNLISILTIMKVATTFWTSIVMLQWLDVKRNMPFHGKNSFRGVTTFCGTKRKFPFMEAASNNRKKIWSYFEWWENWGEWNGS